MSWREIPKSVEDVLAYIPVYHNWKIKSDSGKLFYWVADTKHNKNPLIEYKLHPDTDLEYDH